MARWLSVALSARSHDATIWLRGLQRDRSQLGQEPTMTQFAQARAEWKGGVAKSRQELTSWGTVRTAVRLTIRRLYEGWTRQPSGGRTALDQ